MTDPTMALMALLRKHNLEMDGDSLREAVQLLMQQLIELEASEQIGAGRYERTASRQTQRNGYRPRSWETRVGEAPLRIPKLRQGTYFPSLLEPRKRSEEALLAVIQQAYVLGVSTRKVDEHEPDDLARSRVYIALGRLRQAGERLTEADLAALNRRFEVESRLAYKWSVRAFNLQHGKNGDLLDDAYYWRRRYAVDRLLYLVAILYPQANSALLGANLFGDDQRRRSNAIEMLDTLLPRPHKERLLPLLESPPEQIAEIAGREYGLKPPALRAELAAALAGNDPWLAACILFSRSRGHVVEHSDLIHEALRLPDALVRETALWAVNQNIPAAVYETASPAAVYQDHSPKPPGKSDIFLPPSAETQEGGPVMPLTTMERILLLRRVALFRETPAQELELVARLCDVLYFAPGERFMTEGDPSDGLYILVAGEVEVSTADFGIIDARKEGDVIGEIGVLANQLRTASCTATVETTALYIDQTDLWDLLERNATLSVSAIRVLVPILLSYSEKRSSLATDRAPVHMLDSK